MDDRTIVDPIWDEANAAFSEQEIADLRAQAVAAAKEERKRIVRDQLQKTLLAEERAKLIPSEKTVEITISVPAMAIINKLDETGICYNGKWYVHGNKYPVPLSLARDLQYIMYKSDFNERAVGSPSRDLKVRTRIDARSDVRIPQIVEIG